MDEKAYSIGGSAVDAVGESGSSGFKPIAKLLVHMADLQQIENVWLDSSSKSDFSDSRHSPSLVAAEMSQETSATNTTASAPAPPTQ